MGDSIASDRDMFGLYILESVRVRRIIGKRIMERKSNGEKE